jgi:hypothetical protein
MPGDKLAGGVEARLDVVRVIGRNLPPATSSSRVQFSLTGLPTALDRSTGVVEVARAVFAANAMPTYAVTGPLLHSIRRNILACSKIVE